MDRMGLQATFMPDLTVSFHTVYQPMVTCWIHRTFADPCYGWGDEQTAELFLLSVCYSNRANTKSKVNLLLSLLTYLLTPYSTVLLEKLTGWQPVKKFPTFYGTRRFITALKSARQMSIFWASSIQSGPPHTTSWISILILYSHLSLGLPIGFFPQVSPPKHCTHNSPSHTRYMPRPSNFPVIYTVINVAGLEAGKSEKRKLLILQLLKKRGHVTGLQVQHVTKITIMRTAS
jgi:hypothetical protein